MSQYEEQERYDEWMAYRNELQAGLEWSRANRKPDDSGSIDLALLGGYYCVVSEGVEYCPVTDASMGTRRVLVSTHLSREEAEAAAFREGEHDGDDCWTYVLPLVHRPLASLPMADDNSLPF